MKTRLRAYNVSHTNREPPMPSGTEDCAPKRDRGVTCCLYCAPVNGGHLGPRRFGSTLKGIPPHLGWKGPRGSLSAGCCLRKQPSDYPGDCWQHIGVRGVAFALGMDCLEFEKARSSALGLVVCNSTDCLHSNTSIVCLWYPTHILLPPVKMRITFSFPYLPMPIGQ